MHLSLKHKVNIKESWGCNQPVSALPTELPGSTGHAYLQWNGQNCPHLMALMPTYTQEDREHLPPPACVNGLF